MVRSQVIPLILVFGIVITSFTVLIILNNQDNNEKLTKHDFLFQNGVNITWCGGVGFKFKTEDLTIFIDPVNISLNQIEPADIIIVTHHHSDHLSIEDMTKIAFPSITEFFYPEFCNVYFEEFNSSFTKHDVLPYENFIIKGIELDFVPSYTITSTTHMKDFNLVGVNINFGDLRIFHPGDTENIPELQSIVTDIALVPIYNMDYGVGIVDYLKTSSELDYVIPMHYNDIEDAKEFIKEIDTPYLILSPQ